MGSSMDDKEYIATQFDWLTIVKAQNVLKVANGARETNWITVSDEQLEKIKLILQGAK